MEWLDAEHGGVAGAVATACERARWRETVQLTSDMATYWEFRRHSREWTAAAEAALQAAQHLSAHDVCTASSNLGNAYRVNHQPDKALPHLERAALLAPNEPVRGWVLHNLGLVQYQLGRYRDAASNHQADLDICCSRGDVLGAAQALVALGDAQCMLGRHVEAADTLLRALSILDAVRDGHVHVDGEDTGALADTSQNAHINLGRTLLLWNPSEYGHCGIWHLCHALRIAIERDNRAAQLVALSNLAALYLAICPDCYAQSALNCATHALALSEQGGDPIVAAGALLSLGWAHLALGDGAAGTAALRQGQEAYAALGRPEADKIPSPIQESTGKHGGGCRAAAGAAEWRRPLHESVLEGDYDELEHITFYGFRYAVWN
ncbi:tetratricopeptide repeat protein [Streptomyces longwoodensis]|uniref:tetratricopeptide repeat protein n=1 Tax=Streptomyces longwoodensis TaxID=68231 RepID=UPI0033D0D000